MLARERRGHLLEIIRVRGFASLPELAKSMSVSESTVRRDVENLEQQGVVSRVHGGVLYTGTAPRIPQIDTLHPDRWEQKRAIARETVKLIEDGETVLLDGGSTTYEVARLLVGRPLHVVTTSLPVANLFARDGTSDLVMVGGSICPRTGVARGPHAAEMISSLRVRKTIFSVAGIDHDGFFNNNLLLVETERAMMRAADEVVVVADSSKFGHQSLTHVCALGDVKNLVVDSGITDEWKQRVIAAGIHLRIAPVGDKESAS